MYVTRIYVQWYGLHYCEQCNNTTSNWKLKSTTADIAKFNHVYIQTGQTITFFSLESSNTKITSIRSRTDFFLRKMSLYKTLPDDFKIWSRVFYIMIFVRWRHFKYIEKCKTKWCFYLFDNDLTREIVLFCSKMTRIIFMEGFEHHFH